MLPNCAPSIRCTITMLPPESSTTMQTFQLFFFASASAPAMTFLASSRLIAMPYGGGGGGAAAGGCCALPVVAARTNAAPMRGDRSRSIFMGVLLGEWIVGCRAVHSGSLSKVPYTTLAFDGDLCLKREPSTSRSDAARSEWTCGARRSIQIAQRL